MLTDITTMSNNDKMMVVARLTLIILFDEKKNKNSNAVTMAIIQPRVAVTKMDKIAVIIIANKYFAENILYFEK